MVRDTVRQLTDDELGIRVRAAREGAPPALPRLTTEQKIARNLELAEKFFDGYTNVAARNGRMEGWTADDIAENATMYCPWFGEAEFPQQDWGSLAYWEYQAELAILPDFGTTRPFAAFPTDVGCMMKTFVGGHDSSGEFFECAETEAFYTDDYGRITRLEFYLDWWTIVPFLTRLTGLSPNELTVQNYERRLREVAERLVGAPPES